MKMESSVAGGTILHCFPNWQQNSVLALIPEFIVGLSQSGGVRKERG